MRTTRTMTVMFTDLVGSTDRALRVGPARADELRVEHFGILAAVVEEHRGTAVKSLGDGLMAVFESAAAAADAAVSIQQRIEAASRAQPDAPTVRVALAVGEVSSEGDDWFGSAVVEAARLCASTEARQILCTDLVRALAEHEGGHSFRSLGALQFKGFPALVAVDEVVWSPLTDRGLEADFADVDRDPRRPLGCLDLQQDSKFFAEVRDRILALLDPQPGQTVLDVGCGAGQDVIHLASLVGPGGGRAIGVDKSHALVDEARARAASVGVAGVEFQVGVAEALPFDDDSVDAARSDRVFQYLPDPARAVAELVRVVRPGGPIVVADTDWGASVFDGDDLDLVARVDDAWTATRASGRVGRRLFGLFVRAGLEDVRVFPHVLALTDVRSDKADARYAAQLYCDGVIPALAQQAVDAGAVTAEEGARWRAMQLEAARSGTFFRLLVMLVVAARVPDAG